VKRAVMKAMSFSTKLRKGDQVCVMTGRDKGKEGRVLRVVSDKHTIVVERLNMVKKHARPTQKSPQGGIIEREAPMNISNVMIVCASCNKPTRIGMKPLSEGKKLRVCKRCGEVLSHENR